MSAVISSLNPGSAIYPYPLLEEIMSTYDVSRSEAHEGIHILLGQIMEIDGEEAVILRQEPIEPNLLHDNPRDLNVYYWITITDDAADTIREAWAADAANPDGY
ncbi:hypothetical protein ACMA1D_01835 [Streptomyces sp. 796.1]|uniref:hypothetical protein n=1 Tax=Streptomyces sp. 796.1 TaxID=3163029 RepID=UPI0039C9A2AA